MDIEKFNKKLQYKIAKAKALEKKNQLEDAIEAWIDISEYVLHASKAKGLEFSYKSMLIEKTEGIIDHIKELKLKLAGYDRKEIELAQSYLDESKNVETGSSPEIEASAEETIGKGFEENVVKQNVEVVEESEFKNMPEGFKEIKATKDFKIITPHDQEYVKNLITDEPNTSNLKPDENINEKKGITKLDSREFRKSKKEGVGYCFACGSEVPLNAKTCPTCQAKLDEE